MSKEGFSGGLYEVVPDRSKYGNLCEDFEINWSTHLESILSLTKIMLSKPDEILMSGWGTGVDNESKCSCTYLLESQEDSEGNVDIWCNCCKGYLRIGGQWLGENNA